MMKPHHPQNRKKEGKKREEGRRDWEEGENGGKEKGRKRKIKLIHVDLEEPEPGEHLAKPLGGGQPLQTQFLAPNPHPLRAGGQGPTVRKPSHSQKGRTMGKREKQRSIRPGFPLTPGGDRHSHQPRFYTRCVSLTYNHFGSEPGLPAPLEPPNLFERLCSLRKWEDVPGGVFLPGWSPR